MSAPIDVLSTENIRMLEREISKCIKSCNLEVLWPGFVPSKLLMSEKGELIATACALLREEMSF
jgi:hypothetical protein